MINRTSERRSKPLADQLGRQIIKQLGIARRIGQAEIVDRIHQAAAHHVIPDEIGLGSREQLVLG